MDVRELILDEEEEEEADLEGAQVEQAAVASLIDVLSLAGQKDCAVCTPVCGERFSHLTMSTKVKGYARQWVCMDREACMERANSLAGGGRVRKAARVS